MDVEEHRRPAPTRNVAARAVKSTGKSRYPGVGSEGKIRVESPLGRPAPISEEKAPLTLTRPTK